MIALALDRLASTPTWWLKAFHQDALLWQGLLAISSNDLTIDLDDLPGPAQLGLAACGLELPLTNLRDPDWQAFEPEPHTRAATALTAWLTGTVDNPTLVQAAWIALALREQLAFYGSWDFLEPYFREITNRWSAPSGTSAVDQPAQYSLTRCALACLAGFEPQPSKLIPYLLSTYPALGVEVFLCQPATEAEQLAWLGSWLPNLGLTARFQVLLALAHARPDLANLLPMDLTGLNAPSLELFSLPVQPVLNALQSSAGFADQALLLTACGQPQAAIRAIQRAHQATDRLHGYLNSQEARALESLGSQALSQSELNEEKRQAAHETLAAALQAWERACQLDPEALEYPSRYAWLLLDLGQTERAAEVLAKLSLADPEMLDLNLTGWSYPAACCRLAVNRQQADLAIEQLNQAAGQIETHLARSSQDFTNQPKPGLPDHRHWLALANLALELEQPQASKTLALAILAQEASNSAALTLLARSLILCSEPDALQPAWLAGRLKPNLENQHLLVASLELNQEWSDALGEQHRLVASLENPNPSDYRKLAACALQAGQPETAYAACQQALALDPQDGLALLQVGEIAASEGKPEQALVSYTQACRLAPDLELPWLRLAGLQEALGQPDLALETLRQGSCAAPESARIQLALGQALLAQEAPSQALPALKNAFSLAFSGRPPHQHQLEAIQLRRAIAATLGESQRRLGFLEESRQTFETVCLSPVYACLEQPEIVYNYAQTLLGLGEFRQALPWLERVTAQAVNYPAYLNQARAILALEPDPEQVELAIQRLETYLEHAQAVDLTADQAESYAEAVALFADALGRAGRLEQAIQAYRQALNTRLAQHTTWRYTLSFGLGRVALALGQNETAIAALLEARQLDDSDHTLHQTLATAYASLDLSVDAYHSAAEAARLDQDSPETLAWFASQCLALIEKPSGRGLPASQAAVRALERATELAPQSAGLIVQLAKAHLAAGEAQAALNSLDRLLAAPEGELTLTLNDLEQAAAIYNSIQAPAQAAAALLQAVHLAEAEAPGLPAALRAGLAFQLSQAYADSGELTLSLEAINQSLDLAPEALAACRQKVNIQLSLQDLTGALATLVQAENLAPQAWDLPVQKGLILSAIGDLPAAIQESQRAAGLAQVQPEVGLSADRIAFINWLANALSQAHDAEPAIQNPAPDPGQLSPLLRLYQACQQAELAFNTTGNLQQAIETAGAALAGALEIAPRHPYLLSLQARLSARQEGIEPTHPAESPSWVLFETACQEFDAYEETGLVEVINLEELAQPFFRNLSARLQRLACLHSLVDAALELNAWPAAQAICQAALQQDPYAPRSFSQAIKMQVRRAESQRLHQAIEVVAHAPGAEALSDQAAKIFQAWLQQAQERFTELPETARKNFQRWQARGLAVFQPGLQSTARLENYLGALTTLSVAGVDDLAALIWAYSQSAQAEKITEIPNLPTNHPLISLSLALAIARDKPEQALQVVDLALERLVAPDLDIPDALPLLHSLSAILASASPDPATVSRALPAIERALTIWPEEPRWHDLAARLLLQATDRQQENANVLEDSVLEHLKQAAQLEPGLAEHHLKLGQYYLLHGELAQAQKAVEQATQAEPENALAWLTLAELYKMAGQYEKAITSAERAAAYALASSQQAGAKRLEQEQTTLEGADLADRTPLEALLMRSELALLTNNPRSAASRAQAILNSHPEQPQAWFILAQALAAMEQLTEALAAIDQAIRLADEPLEMLRLRVQLLYRLRGPANATEAIRGLNENYVQDPVLNRLLADYCLELGDPESALKAARLALQNSQVELDASAQTHLHLLIGRQARLAGQLDQAVYELSEAIRKSPGDIEPYLELGRAYQDRRQVNQAMEIYQGAAKMAPQDYRPYFQAGLVLKECKDYPEAENMLRRAAHLAPNEVSIHRQLAAVVALNLVHNRRLVSTE